MRGLWCGRTSLLIPLYQRDEESQTLHAKNVYRRNCSASSAPWFFGKWLNLVYTRPVSTTVLSMDRWCWSGNHATPVWAAPSVNFFALQLLQCCKYAKCINREFPQTAVITEKRLEKSKSGAARRMQGRSTFISCCRQLLLRSHFRVSVIKPSTLENERTQKAHKYNMWGKMKIRLYEMQQCSDSLGSCPRGSRVRWKPLVNS